VHFAFTDQQLEFRDAVRQVLAKVCTTDDLRAAYNAPAARTSRWAALAELGVVGLQVPEDRGGLGLGLVDLVLLLEEAGRVALPEPLVETSALTAPLLAELGSTVPGGPATSAAWLEAIAEGSVAAAVAETSEPSVPVPGANGADLLVLVAPGDGGGPEIHVVGADRVAVTLVPSLDPTRRLGRVGWSPGIDTRAASGEVAASGIRRSADRAAVASAAQLLGLTDRMITMAADYARERHQFGKPIGSFQAVKHLLAGAQVALEFARPVVYAAAWALDEGEADRSRLASTAKAYASEAATEAARVSLQVHGAIGYTWECDLHLFLKRAWALSEAWGSAADHRHRLLASLVGER
jgi:alkylation response protein AidB-like acyl-CoA dehydrogenase